MNAYRRIAMIALAAVLILTLAACGDTDSNNDNNIPAPSSGTSTPSENTTIPVQTATNDWPEIPLSDWSYEYNPELEGVVITKYSGNASSVRIPDTINGDPVVRIERDVFEYNNALNEVYIPDSVTFVGYLSFQGCGSLKSVVIPASVLEVGSGAFIDCKELSEITLLGHTVRVGLNAFLNTYWYNRQPDGFLCLGNTLIKYKSEADNISVSIPDGITVIGDGAFEYCAGLTSVTIPDSVTIIGDSAFSACTSLSSVVIPDGVTEIGFNAFNGCESLASVIIPDSVTVIDSLSFRGCILDDATKQRILSINPDTKF